jgi:hypothetical protein
MHAWSPLVLLEYRASVGAALRRVRRATAVGAAPMPRELLR